MPILRRCGCLFVALALALALPPAPTLTLAATARPLILGWVSARHEEQLYSHKCERVVAQMVKAFGAHRYKRLGAAFNAWYVCWYWSTCGGA
jgi:hypothetical protein